MKKKQILSLATATVLSLTIFAGCSKGDAKKDDAKPAAGSEAKYKDGTFKAEYDNFDERGWKAVTTVEVKDGKIAKVDFTSVNKEGKLKRDDEGYNTNMEKTAKTSPKKYEGELAKKLVEKQDPDKVDVITGATHSTEDFKKLSKAALENAKTGKTETAKVELKK
ncbi:FMN-binding protein [Clostridium sp. MSJ-4]|uniref:FMN-binding protein n=1 Tax=Clostridium simiarum TaxID=2841506 RepID=A0ABS6EVL7_9CLOT|nr:FMN-binding protein [Clostridium simiarum]MBU5590265.1 FMN-binding protein [Clostridium simiarum]